MLKRCYSCFKEYSEALPTCPHCGSLPIVEPLEPIHLTPGTMVGDRYIIGLALGSGGFGIVYKAWDTKLDVFVAIKEYYPKNLVMRPLGQSKIIINPKHQEEFDYRRRRFLAEARSMAKFGSHKSIPNVFEFFDENGTSYIVMELLEGMSLKDYLDQTGGVIDTEFARAIANEVGNALKSLHQQGIIHKDVAPDNIYICADREIIIKLMDLGAADLPDDDSDVIDIVLKPGYSPVEQYDTSKNIGRWTDIYALGATIYRAVTGIKPDDAPKRRDFDNVIPPHDLNPGIPENFSNAIMKAMAVDKNLRFQNVDAFLNALNGDVIVATPEDERKKRLRNRNIGIAAAICVLLAIGAFAFNKYLSTKPPQDVEIDMWINATSDELIATQEVVASFQDELGDIGVNIICYSNDEYEAKLREAYINDTMPDVFESTGITSDLMKKTIDLDEVLKSDEASECYFLDQYDSFYHDHKRLPLAIEIPVAYVVTSGPSSSDYYLGVFQSINDFKSSTKAQILGDENHKELIQRNFDDALTFNRNAFLGENTSPVLISTNTVEMEAKESLLGYDWHKSLYSGEVIKCDFTYEFSISENDDDKDKERLAILLLRWLLKKDAQTTLMRTRCYDGKILINKEAFDEISKKDSDSWYYRITSKDLDSRFDFTR